MEGGVSVPEDRDDAAKQAAGLVRVEVWVPKGQEGLVALYAEMIRAIGKAAQSPQVTTPLTNSPT